MIGAPTQTNPGILREVYLEDRRSPGNWVLAHRTRCNPIDVIKSVVLQAVAMAALLAFVTWIINASNLRNPTSPPATHPLIIVAIVTCTMLAIGGPPIVYWIAVRRNAHLGNILEWDQHGRALFVGTSKTPIDVERISRITIIRGPRRWPTTTKHWVSYWFLFEAKLAIASDQVSEPTTPLTEPMDEISLLRVASDAPDALRFLNDLGLETGIPVQVTTLTRAQADQLLENDRAK